ncbi:MAG: MCE family protein [Alphaproteobacteria bacterium]|nr:MCE family protein [Alphaproteobacteria bacterium]
METRANHVAVGAFVLLAVLGLIGFVVWLAKVDLDREFDHYTIYFTGGVTGLSKSGEVRFRGVPVGAVSEIALDPKDPQQVRVVIEVQKGTPVRTDTVASLEAQGITGIAFVQLTGGSPSSAPVAKPPGEKHPVIASKPSTIEALVNAAPELLGQIAGVLGEMGRLVDDRNRQALAETLANLARLTGQAADRIGPLAQRLDRIADELQRSTQALDGRMDRAAADLAETLKTVRGAMTAVETIAGRDLPPTMTEVRAAAKSTADLTGELKESLGDMRRPVGNFAAEGLEEFSRLVLESRHLVGALTRLADQLESGEAGRILLGDRPKDRKPER